MSKPKKKIKRIVRWKNVFDTMSIASPKSVGVRHMDMEFIGSVHASQLSEVKDHVRDNQRWKQSELGLYSVSKGYRVLQQQSFVGEVGMCAASIWKVAALSNVKRFTWRALLDRIESKTNLIRRNVFMDNSGQLCSFCSQQMETINHLLLNCGFASLVWNSNYDWFSLKECALHYKLCNHFQQHVMIKGNIALK